tara:strand:+ start:2058 stop:2579 length:522 start_codon:yes stop_codon:yes gene_type:complete
MDNLGNYDLSETKPDGTFWPDQNFDVPEVEILSDDESIWGLTDPRTNDISFINREMSWRRTEEDWRQLARAERRNDRRIHTLDEILREIETLTDAGNDADTNNNTWYNWNHHNNDMRWLQNTRANLEAEIANSQRNQRRSERSILRNRIPHARPQFKKRRVRANRYNGGFQQY